MSEETLYRALYTVHLTNTNSPHNKFYDINVDRIEPSIDRDYVKYRIWCQWGRIGTTGNITPTNGVFYTPAKTNVEIDKIIRKKQEKGYSIISDNRNDFSKLNAEEAILKFKQPEKELKETKPLPFSSTSRFRGIL